jgi:polysaccharide export outer membrane protein
MSSLLSSRQATNLRFLFMLLVSLNSLTSLAQEQSLLVNNYKLDSGDTIRITIFEDETMTLETRLDETGLITYKYIAQPISVNGMSVQQLKEFIYDELTRAPAAFVAPTIQVTILEYRPFFIDGAVNNPGGYPYQPGLNVSRAITLAGGMTDVGDEDDIYVVRASNPEQGKIAVSLTDKVFPGDQISVEESVF